MIGNLTRRVTPFGLRANLSREHAMREAFIALILLSLAACKSNKSGAREHFAKKFSCPEDRVTIVERSDMKWGSIILDGQQPEPPAEIKADPGRLAKWQKDKADEQKESRATLDALDVFEGNGCNHSALMGCGHASDSEGGCDPSHVVCWEREKK
jgi:hypothetical protein